MAKGRENLKKGVRFTEDTAREKGRRGAIKANEAKRKKKVLKEVIEMALSMKIPDMYKEPYMKFMDEETLEKADLMEGMVISLINKAMTKGDVNAFTALADRLEGRPTQYIESNNTNNQKLDDKDRYIMENFLTDMSKKKPAPQKKTGDSK